MLRICVFAICALASLPLAAQNLLQNPGFATALDPWVPNTGFNQTTVWSGFDAGGDPDSGSAMGTIPADDAFGETTYADVCVVIEPNTTYLYGGNAFMPSATTSPGATSYVDIQFYANTGCFGNNDLAEFTHPVSTRDIWTQMLGVATSGAGDQSVYMNMYVYAPTGIAMQSYFDDMFLIPDAIFHDDFE